MVPARGEGLLQQSVGAILRVTRSLPWSVTSPVSHCSRASFWPFPKQTTKLYSFLTWEIDRLFKKMSLPCQKKPQVQIKISH